MKAAIYHNQHDIRIQEVPKPTIKEDEILVEMKACGVCGSDLMEWYLKTRAPLVLGHEPSGVVAEKGSKVKDFDVGDRVFVHHHVACLTCRYCIHGDYTLCSRFHETNIKPGGFAEFFEVPAPNTQIDTLRIPKVLSFEEATLIEPAGCCIRALKKCNIQTGDIMAIIGAGTTGIILTALSKHFGASLTIVSDLFDSRIDAAKNFGADITVNPTEKKLAEVIKAETNGGGADIVIVTAPNTEAYRAGLKACRRGGKLCLFAPTDPGKTLEVSPKELFFSEVQIIPSYSTSHLETRLALNMIASKRIDAKALITHRFSLDKTSEAFKTALECKDSLKVVVLNE